MGLLPVAAALLAQAATAPRPRFPLPHLRTTNFTQMGNLPTGLGPDAGGQGGYVAGAEELKTCPKKYVRRLGASV